MELAPGLDAEITHVVTASDTAQALGSGDVPVLGTPKVLALAEQATVAAVAGALKASSTTVGYRVTMEHLAPTAVGATVRATATLTAVDGRNLEFRVAVAEGTAVVAQGTVVRILVDRERFLGPRSG